MLPVLRKYPRNKYISGLASTAWCCRQRVSSTHQHRATPQICRLRTQRSSRLLRAIFGRINGWRRLIEQTRPRCIRDFRRSVMILSTLVMILVESVGKIGDRISCCMPIDPIVLHVICVAFPIHQCMHSLFRLPAANTLKGSDLMKSSIQRRQRNRKSCLVAHHGLPDSDSDSTCFKNALRSSISGWVASAA